MDFIDPQILRTDFSNEPKWNQLCDLVKTPNREFGFEANIEFVNDPQLKSIKPEKITERLSKQYLNDFDFFFVADKITLEKENFPILCVKISDESNFIEGSFRVIPSEIWCVESNLRISNMDFEEFLNSVNSEGVFAGFL